MPTLPRTGWASANNTNVAPQAQGLTGHPSIAERLNASLYNRGIF
jgi:hypothetical protein